MAENFINKPKILFTKDSLWWLRVIILVQVMFLSAMITFLGMQHQAKPKPTYFALKKGDQLIDPLALDKPSLTEAELLNWVTEAMIVSFSFNYHNYNNIMDQITDYFDPLGKDSYLKIITENKQIQQVINKKLILSGRPTGAPRIIKDGIVDGRYAWEVSLPFILRLRNQQFRQDLELTLNLFIVRVPEKEAPLGVKIVKINI